MLLDQNDSYFRQNVLGCLQKFSLRKQAQSLMIDNSVIEWIVTLLSLQNQSQQPLSEYSLEYATALLMNLSLRSKGKTVCEKMLS